MALNPRYRMKDKDLLFSSAQALTVTTQAYSTSEIDFVGTDVAAGSDVNIVVKVSAISATAASTLAITVVSGTATAPTTAILTIPTVTGSAAFERIISLPKNTTSRFVRLGYLLTGSAASNATITAYALARPVGN
jgi:hypothetical protein